MQTVDPQTMALATALLGFLSSIITQVAKRWISKDYRAVFALIISLIVSALAVGVNVLTTMIQGGSVHFDGAALATAIMGVVGVSQAIYAAVYKLADNNTPDYDIYKPDDNNKSDGDK